MKRTRRHYNSPEAVRAAVEREYRYVWNKYITVPQPPSIIYHYCRADVFPKILNTRNLWASDVLRMNDEREIIYPIRDVLAPIVSEAGDDGNPRYFLKDVKDESTIREVWGSFQTHIACLSADADIPSQWAMYAKDGGYAIGLDLARLDTWCDGKQISLFAMNYDPSAHTAVFREFLEREARIETNRNLVRPSPAQDALRSQAQVHLMSLAMAIKAESWRGEQEWRVLIIEPEDKKPPLPLLTRPDGVLYCELPICTPGLLAEVILGPQCTATESEVKRLLDDTGFSSVWVRRASFRPA